MYFKMVLSRSFNEVLNLSREKTFKSLAEDYVEIRADNGEKKVNTAFRTCSFLRT